MSDLIERQDAIDAVNNAFDRETLLTGFVRSIAVRAIRDLPTAEPEEAVMIDKETILQAGYKNREVEFRIGGRLFRVREVAQ